MLKFFTLPYLILELITAYFFIHLYGFFNLVLETIFTGIIGILLMSSVGFFEMFSRLILIGTRDIFGKLGIALGGFLLFIPGILTDIFGILIVIIGLLNSKRDIQNTPKIFEENFINTRNDGEIIDVEIIEERHK
jgi:2-isopropylmalate synthase (alpha-isopropylmalatesynthase) (alpha-IPM synthetase)